MYSRFRALLSGVAQLRRIENLEAALRRIETSHEQILINQGTALAAQNSHRQITSLHDIEFKIFSQWGEDGIIQFLVANLDIKNRTFIEFGIEDFRESNCRFLMMKDNWRGYVIDSSERLIEALKNQSYYWKFDLNAQLAFITRDNIAALLELSGFDKDVGLLSIDLDGTDYWIAKELMHWKPRILIMEYNAVFGAARAITIPYSADFNRTAAHPSNLYFGASLKALCKLTDVWGYSPVGTTSAGNNAFFVRNDLLNDVVRARSFDEAFTPSKFRESRDADGRLTFISGEERLRTIAGLKVVNVDTNQIEEL
jgi:hypothetical protein